MERGERPRSGAGGIPCASEPSTSTMPHGTSPVDDDDDDDDESVAVITIASGAAVFDALRDDFFGFLAAASAVSAGDEADKADEAEAANLRRSSAPMAAGECPPATSASTSGRDQPPL